MGETGVAKTLGWFLSLQLRESAGSQILVCLLCLMRPRPTTEQGKGEGVRGVIGREGRGERDGEKRKERGER